MSIFESLDLISQQKRLTLLGNFKLKTNIGAFFTLITVIISVIIIIYQGYDLFISSTPNLLINQYEYSYFSSNFSTLLIGISKEYERNALIDNEFYLTGNYIPLSKYNICASERLINVQFINTSNLTYYCILVNKEYSNFVLSLDNFTDLINSNLLRIGLIYINFNKSISKLYDDVIWLNQSVILIKINNQYVYDTGVFLKNYKTYNYSTYFIYPLGQQDQLEIQFNFVYNSNQYIESRPKLQYILAQSFSWIFIIYGVLQIIYGFIYKYYLINLEVSYFFQQINENYDNYQIFLQNTNYNSKIFNLVSNKNEFLRKLKDKFQQLLQFKNILFFSLFGFLLSKYNEYILYNKLVSDIKLFFSVNRVINPEIITLTKNLTILQKIDFFSKPKFLYSVKCKNKVGASFTLLYIISFMSILFYFGIDYWTTPNIYNAIFYKFNTNYTDQIQKINRTFIIELPSEFMKDYKFTIFDQVKYQNYSYLLDEFACDNNSIKNIVGIKNNLMNYYCFETNKLNKILSMDELFAQDKICNIFLSRCFNAKVNLLDNCNTNFIQYNNINVTLYREVYTFNPSNSLFYNKSIELSNFNITENSEYVYIYDGLLPRIVQNDEIGLISKTKLETAFYTSFHYESYKVTGKSEFLLFLNIEINNLAEILSHVEKNSFAQVLSGILIIFRIVSVIIFSLYIPFLDYFFYRKLFEKYINKLNYLPLKTVIDFRLELSKISFINNEIREQVTNETLKSIIRDTFTFINYLKYYFLSCFLSSKNNNIIAINWVVKAIEDRYSIENFLTLEKLAGSKQKNNNIFSKLDIFFQTNDILYINDENSFKTNFGGVLLILYYIIFCIVFVLIGIDFLKKQNPSITFTNSPDGFNLTVPLNLSIQQYLSKTLGQATYLNYYDYMGQLSELNTSFYYSDNKCIENPLISNDFIIHCTFINNTSTTLPVEVNVYPCEAIDSQCHNIIGSNNNYKVGIDFDYYVNDFFTEDRYVNYTKSTFLEGYNGFYVFSIAYQTISLVIDDGWLIPHLTVKNFTTIVGTEYYNNNYLWVIFYNSFTSPFIVTKTYMKLNTVLTNTFAIMIVIQFIFESVYFIISEYLYLKYLEEVSNISLPKPLTLSYFLKHYFNKKDEEEDILSQIIQKSNILSRIN